MKILRKGEIGFGIMIESDAGFICPELNKNILSEGFKFEPNKPLYIDCILQKYDVENKNGRYYPESILKRENEKYQELIKAGSGIGECEHSESSNISLQNLSHMIVKTWWEGNTLYGKLKIIITKGYIDMGICSVIGDKILLYLQSGVRIGISSRGLGTLKNVGGKNIVQDDFELICFDLVASPSTPGAYLFYKNDNIEDVKESFTPTLNDKLKPNVDQKLLNGLNIFLNIN